MGELYLSFLSLDKLKKMTTTKNHDRISSEHKTEIQDEARRVGLLLKEYDSLWTEQGCSSARRSSRLSRKPPPVKEAQTTSTSLTSDPVKNPRLTKNQVQETSDRRKELRRHSPPLYNQRHCGQKSYDPNHVRTKDPKRV